MKYIYNIKYQGGRGRMKKKKTVDARFSNGRESVAHVFWSRKPYRGRHQEAPLSLVRQCCPPMQSVRPTREETQILRRPWTQRGQGTSTMSSQTTVPVSSTPRKSCTLKTHSWQQWNMLCTRHRSDKKSHSSDGEINTTLSSNNSLF